MVLFYLILSNYVVNDLPPELRLSQIQRYNYNALNIAENFRMHKFIEMLFNILVFDKFSINI